MAGIPILVDSAAAHMMNQFRVFDYSTVESVVEELEHIVKREHSSEIHDLATGETREGVYALGIETKYSRLNSILSSPLYAAVSAFVDSMKPKHDFHNILKGILYTSLKEKSDIFIELSHMENRGIGGMGGFFMMCKRSAFYSDMHDFGFSIHVDEPIEIKVRSRMTETELSHQFVLEEVMGYLARQTSSSVSLKYNPQDGVFYIKKRKEKHESPRTTEELREIFDFEGQFSTMKDRYPQLSKIIATKESIIYVLSYFRKNPKKVVAVDEGLHRRFSEYIVLFLQHTLADCITMLKARDELSLEKLEEEVLRLHRARYSIKRLGDIFDENLAKIKQLRDTYLPQIEANWHNLQPVIDTYKTTVKRYVELLSAAELIRTKRVAFLGACPDMQFFLDNVYTTLRRKKHLFYVSSPDEIKNKL